MSLQTHLSELERKHEALEREIQDAISHPSTDDLRIVELKRRKLHLKDEINRLRTGSTRVVH
ncbi:YdcH family protein [Methylobacterium oryzisoli]|uniref:YdcH family protein n=1 Tax=Methylobacterium oryzisoli TaxID=3385502 RepID=UPI0038929EEE